MAIKFCNFTPAAGKWVNVVIDAIQHTDGNIYKFADDMPVSVDLYQIIHNTLSYATGYQTVYTYYGGVYTPRSGSEDGNNWTVTSSGLSSDGTLWRAPKAGILKNAKITVQMWKAGSNDQNATFRIFQLYIRLVPEERWLVAEDSGWGWSAGANGVINERSWDLGDISISDASRMVLYYQQVQTFAYSCIGYVRFNITGIFTD